LVKVIQNENASNDAKIRAHSLLIEWHSKATSDALTMRNMLAAAFHANESALLAGAHDPSPHTLIFASDISEGHRTQAPMLNILYKPLWMALERRAKASVKGRQGAERKREAASNRYICAAQDCYIQANKGRALSRCMWHRHVARTATNMIGRRWEM
jgi:hypothetical protein